ncbi:CPCC family cysteine-rich protein [Konateibacter massiliensis]|uniref:CPCC family cysteine-rich protein n=1 Tax=Konateibacter massiliensis TaxID=2002841 RepID=UPI000C155899|nr:CPCC family cysteine-rich protein [Konateibacter massiliensis]
MKYQCPCCEFYTYSIAPKDDEGYICPVCFWENDVFLENDTEYSCCNHGITLREAKRNYKEFKACEFSMISYVRLPKEDELKE